MRGHAFEVHCNAMLIEIIDLLGTDHDVLFERLALLILLMLLGIITLLYFKRRYVSPCRYSVDLS